MSRRVVRRAQDFWLTLRMVRPGSAVAEAPVTISLGWWNPAKRDWSSRFETQEKRTGDARTGYDQYDDITESRVYVARLVGATSTDVAWYAEWEDFLGTVYPESEVGHFPLFAWYGIKDGKGPQIFARGDVCAVGNYPNWLLMRPGLLSLRAEHNGQSYGPIHLCVQSNAWYNWGSGEEEDFACQAADWRLQV